MITMSCSQWAINTVASHSEVISKLKLVKTYFTAKTLTDISPNYFKNEMTGFLFQTSLGLVFYHIKIR